MFRGGYFGSFLESMMGGGRGRQSNLDKLLDNGEDTPLEQVLSDSEIVTECKWGNQRLMNYFNHDKVGQLLEFITQMPSEDDTHDRGHKFPFIASEIFNCELQKINDLFFTSRAEEEESTDKQPRKEISSSPLPKDDSDEDEEEEEEEEEHHDDAEEDVAATKDAEAFTATTETETEEQAAASKEEEETTQLASPEKVEQATSATTTTTEEQDEDEPVIIEKREAEEAIVEAVTEEEPVAIEQTAATESDKEEQVVEESKEATDLEEEKKVDEQPPTKSDEEEEQSETQVADRSEQYKVDSDDNVVSDDAVEVELRAEDEQLEVDNHGQDDLSTAPTTQAPQYKMKSNKYELFEKLLSFLETPEGEPLNPVLCGYFCKVFAQLVSNKPKEVYSYIYTHTNVLENLVKHSYQKSISDVLIRILNTSENLFFDIVDYAEINSIRASFVFKLVQKLRPETPNGLEDHLNATQILSELAEYKALYGELTSARCFEEYVRNLTSDCESSKQNTYILLQQLVSKSQSDDESSHHLRTKQTNNRYGINNSGDSDEDEEASPRANKSKLPEIENSKLFEFVKMVIQEFAVPELKTPEDKDFLDDPHPHERQYGQCRKPFGVLRMRIIEFLTEAFKVYYRPVLHQEYLDTGLYDALLFFFDHYPFHNILHLKVCEIFMTLLERSAGDDSLINSVLGETHLLKKILDTSKEGALYTLQSTGLTLNRGFMPFVRKLANKIVDLSKNSQEVANFLDAIPEWAEYYENDLKKQNEIEAKPLGQDPRNKKEAPSDDILDLMFKIKDINSGQKKGGVSLLSQSKKEGEDKENGDDEDDENDHEDEEEDHEGDNILGATAKGPLNTHGFGTGDDDDEEDDSQEVFDRIMLKNSAQDEDDEDESEQLDSGIEKKGYYSNTPCVEKGILETPHFGGGEGLTLDDIKTTNSTKATEKSEYHSQFYWHVDLVKESAIDDLLKDYE